MVKFYKYDDDIKLVIDHSSNVDKIKSIKAKHIEKVIKRRVQDLVEHFEEDGWDIDGHFVIDDIIFDIFGFHLSEYIFGLVNEATETVTEYSKNDRIRITLPKTYVYFDMLDGILTTSKKDKRSERFIIIGEL